MLYFTGNIYGNIDKKQGYLKHLFHKKIDSHYAIALQKREKKFGLERLLTSQKINCRTTIIISANEDFNEILVIDMVF